MSKEAKNKKQLAAAAQEQEAIPVTGEVDCASWFVGGKIDEIQFCREFISLHPMVCVNGQFYTSEGAADQEEIRRLIFLELSKYVTSGLSRKTDNLLDALKLFVGIPDLPTASDAIRLRNGTLRFDGTFIAEAEICRYRLPVRFNPDAAAPVLWTSFLEELLEEKDILTLQEYLGYSLIPSTKGQVMLFLIGEGGEGKSRVTQVCAKLFGNNMNVSSLHKLEHSEYARADLEQKLLMVDDDLRMSALPSTNYIKQIVTQEGKIDLERKHAQSVQREMACRLLCLGNGSPSALYDHSNGFYRRQIILTTKPRPVNRVDDPYFAEKLAEEIEGIFLWCFAGLQRLIANGFHFSISDRAKQNLADLKAIGNNTILFMESEGYFSAGEDCRTTAADFYSVYLLWCRENAEKPVSMRSFSGYLKQNCEKYHIAPSNNIQNRDGRKVRGFAGIKAEVKTDFMPLEGPSPFE